MNRRKFLGITTALGAAALFAGGRSSVAKTYKFPPKAGDITYEVVKTDAQWQEILSDMQYKVLRHEDTERPFTSALNDEKRIGVFHCAGCDLPVYETATKFDSGTGWPSFYQEIEDAVRTKNDYSLFGVRTEVHCRRCGGHFGHIFEDGPEPTGLRHCLNGAALKFEPVQA